MSSRIWYDALFSQVVDKLKSASSIGHEMTDGNVDDLINASSQQHLLNSTSNHAKVLSHLTTELVESALLFVCVAVGVPLNLYSLLRTVVLIRHKTRHVRFALLVLHLHIADLLVLIGHALTHAIWLLTIQWHGGAALCRMSKFMSAFCFSLVSNLLICITAHRVQTSCNILQQHDGHAGVRSAMWLIGVAYTAAVLLALPQLYLFDVLEMIVRETGETVNQCMSQFIILRIGQTDEDARRRLDRIEQLYNLMHLICIVWLPLGIVFAGYCIVITKLAQKQKVIKHSLSMSRSMGHRSGVRVSRNRETVTLPLKCRTNMQPQQQRAKSVKLNAVCTPPPNGCANQAPEAKLVDSQANGNPEIRAMLLTNEHAMGSSPPDESSPQLVDHNSPVHLRVSHSVIVRDQTELITSTGQVANGNSRTVASFMTLRLPRKRTTRRQSYQSDEASQESVLPCMSGNTLKAARDRTAVRATIILLCYTLFWTPYAVFALLKMFNPKQYNAYETDTGFLTSLIVLNTLVNPLVYGVNV